MRGMEGMNLERNSYDYCEISENQGEYLVKFGYQTYNGKIICPPILIGDRSFSSEKKALRYAKKITTPKCIKLEKSK
jgi:hypothetical protein